MHDTSQRTSLRRRDKVALTIALGGLTLGLVGVGANASFTATTASSQRITAGTVKIDLGAAGTGANRLSVDATNIAPGDSIQRAVDVVNTGSLDWSSVTIATAASVSSKLDTDTVNGLQMTVTECSVPWTEAGTAPGYTYACGGVATSLAARSPVVSAARAITTTKALAAGQTSHLRLTLDLPATADNTFQGLSSTVAHTFTAVQRVATDR